MPTITVSARVAHGTLYIDTPIHVPADVPDGEQTISITLMPEHLLWPEGFFEQTYASLAHDVLERPTQGLLEERDVLE